MTKLYISTGDQATRPKKGVFVDEPSSKIQRSESAVYVGDARFSERPCCPQLVSSSAPQERLRKSSFVYKTMSSMDAPCPVSSNFREAGSAMRLICQVQFCGEETPKSDSREV